MLTFTFPLLESGPLDTSTEKDVRKVCGSFWRGYQSSGTVPDMVWPLHMAQQICRGTLK